MSVIKPRTLNVVADINPLHLYRPINDVTHTLLNGGKVERLKDIGRGATASADLNQAVAANRFTHGTDANGNEFMQSLTGDGGTIWLAGSLAADWNFMNNPDDLGCTVACIAEIDEITTQNVLLSTGFVDTTEGMYLALNGTSGTSLVVNRSFGGASALRLMTEAANNGAIGMYSIVARYRDLGTTDEGSNRVEAMISVNDVTLLVSQPRKFDYATGNPRSPLYVGALETAETQGIIGKIYEVAADDIWWSDELASAYHKRAVDEFGAGNMIR